MIVIGIDIAKKSFDATLIDESGQYHYQQFPNTPAGAETGYPFEKLETWLNKHQGQQAHLCMEATNVYGENLAEYLDQQGYQVSVVNPSQTKPLWVPLRAVQKQLRVLSRHLDDKKVIIGAAMRKLRHLAFGFLRHNTPFDPSYSS